MIGKLMSSAAVQAARDSLAALHGMPEVEEVKDSAESKVPHLSLAALHPPNYISSFPMHQTRSGGPHHCRPNGQSHDARLLPR